MCFSMRSLSGATHFFIIKKERAICELESKENLTVLVDL